MKAQKGREFATNIERINSTSNVKNKKKKYNYTPEHIYR